ncbi:MAG: hypothetical protein RIS20_1818 [Bacteroidota bacterium]|jgi:hypothetical protein
MGKINFDIKTKYSEYEKLLAENKQCDEKIIVLDGIKSNHKNTRIKKVKVEHATIPTNVELMVESKIENKRDFKFILRASEFSKEPFFRFDSDGLSHFNHGTGEPLNKEKIDTPHFHKFDSEGRNIAYHTNSLLIDSEKEALLNDVNLCMAHFCDESKTYFKSDYIEVRQTPISEIDYETELFNPLEGENYE